MIVNCNFANHFETADLCIHPFHNSLCDLLSAVFITQFRAVTKNWLFSVNYACFLMLEFFSFDIDCLCNHRNFKTVWRLVFQNK
jgi:hypothetical protein